MNKLTFFFVLIFVTLIGPQLYPTIVVQSLTGQATPVVSGVPRPSPNPIAQPQNLSQQFQTAASSELEDEDNSELPDAFMQDRNLMTAFNAAGTTRNQLNVSNQTIAATEQQLYSRHKTIINQIWPPKKTAATNTLVTIDPNAYGYIRHHPLFPKTKTTVNEIMAQHLQLKPTLASIAILNHPQGEMLSVLIPVATLTPNATDQESWAIIGELKPKSVGSKHQEFSLLSAPTNPFLSPLDRAKTVFQTNKIELSTSSLQDANVISTTRLIGSSLVNIILLLLPSRLMLSCPERKDVVMHPFHPSALTDLVKGRASKVTRLSDLDTGTIMETTFSYQTTDKTSIQMKVSSDTITQMNEFRMMWAYLTPQCSIADLQAAVGLERDWTDSVVSYQRARSQAVSTMRTLSLCVRNVLYTANTLTLYTTNSLELIKMKLGAAYDRWYSKLCLSWRMIRQLENANILQSTAANLITVRSECMVNGCGQRTTNLHSEFNPRVDVITLKFFDAIEGFSLNGNAIFPDLFCLEHAIAACTSSLAWAVAYFACSRDTFISLIRWSRFAQAISNVHQEFSPEYQAEQQDAAMQVKAALDTHNLFQPEALPAQLST